MDIKGEVKAKRNMIMADIGLLFVALFWGGGFVAGKFALEDMSPMNIMAYRYVGAALVMALFCMRKFKLITKKHPSDDRIAIYDTRETELHYFSVHSDGSAVVVDYPENQAVKENPCRGFSRFGWYCAADAERRSYHRAG